MISGRPLAHWVAMSARVKLRHGSIYWPRPTYSKPDIDQRLIRCGGDVFIAVISE